jgi:FkbM family methyltransferase
LTRGRAENALFWSIFTSREYLSLVPGILASSSRPSVFVDCGAAVGYVTLFFEHLIRTNVLPWRIGEFVCIEPSKRNFTLLERNLANNKLPAVAHLNLVGLRSGNSPFYESRANPWSSSVTNRFGAREQVRAYLDIGSYLEKGNCFVKLDIEGSEFEFIRSYRMQLSTVVGLVVEWHYEFGDVVDCEKVLFENGLVLAGTGMERSNRRVSLYVRDMNLKKDQAQS